MPNGAQASRKLPSDLVQIPIVWKYELLKYLRSRRLLAAVAVVVAILALIYLLPPSLGSPYSGTDTQKGLYVQGFGELNLTGTGFIAPQYVGFINRSVVEADTLTVYLDGAAYPSNDGLNWSFTELVYQNQGVNMIFFWQNISGAEITATYSWYTSPQAFDVLFLNFANILIIICATFFGADALVSEYQNRTGYLIFPNPMRRGTLFFGKFTASMTAGVLLVSLFYAGLTVMSYITARGVDDDMLLSFGFAVEYLLAATAVAYFISSVLKGSTGALVLTFFLFMLILPIVDGVSSFSGVKIEASVTFAAGTIIYSLIDPYPLDSAAEFPGMGVTIHSFYPALSTAAIVMFAYAAVAIAISLVMFKRKELAG